MLAQTHADALDAGPRKTPPGTERYCAVSGTVKPVAEMIRFVVGPDGAAVPDLLEPPPWEPERRGRGPIVGVEECPCGARSARR